MGLGMSGMGVGGMNGVGMTSNMGYVGGQNGSLSHISGNKPQGKTFICSRPQTFF